ncbi:glutamine-hydrolyzing GMP synthase [Cysteiniphilum halobium]|uniref:glutamine-hydrolyzing GMP synthase n=1 Tax=Cysteiniphilum halobium TaxID=2219059 RepID=UPI000E6529E4|nr:glutamine-hydrolyzing GMP synthase [Cysteiniphilum halobium]
MQDIHKHRLLILDFGSQYTQLIARRVREIGVYCEIYPYDVDVSFIKDFAANGIILSGGPESVNESAHVRAPQCVFELNVPVLGICYGMQTMAHQFGGEVGSSDKREFGYAKIEISKVTPLYESVPQTQDVWMSHGDKVIDLGDAFEVIASSENAPIAAMAHKTKPYYGVQYHPEVTHSAYGKELLENFAFKICGCEALWNPASIIEDAVQKIKAQVGSDEVVLGLSGGVDSSVVAALLHKAIGAQLTCVFVDTGLLRLHEGDQVMQTFAENMHVNVVRVNAEARFLAKLEGVNDPEKKRKIIGNLFVDIFDEESAKLNNAKWLAQGTIYPDVIESAGSSTGKAHVIKSHHNVGGLPDDMRLGLIEPLRELFKDEVRKVGVELGLPYRMVYRHPFPGPGLGVRILGEVKKDYANILRKADAIYMQELEKSGYYDKVSQAFAVFLPVKSVGVMGDQRKYDYVVALRAVETIDFMTARWAHLPYDLIGNISNRIVNEVQGISRVVYDVTGKPPGTIEWE